jgi:hypothetical protein
MSAIKIAIFAAFATAATVDAVCFCPRVCLPTYKDTCYYRDRTLCADLEAANECNAANTELTDAVNSMGRNADLFLTAAVYNGSLNAAAASFLRTQLTIAMEDNKPVADCEAGMATDTLVKGTKSHCFSLLLLTQCKTLQNTVQGWASGIRGKLNTLARRLDVPPSVSTAFVSAMGDRAEAQTARIRCAAYEVGLEELNSSSPVVLSALLLFAVAVLLV